MKITQSSPHAPRGEFRNPPRGAWGLLSETLTIILFCGLIAAPVLGTAFGWDFYPRQDENRRFAEKAIFAETGLAGYPDAFESYYDDHFGFRNTFIRRYRKLWPKISGKENARVLLGTDNWLYFLGDGVISDYVGANPFSETDLKAWQRLIESRARWLAQRNCAYVYAVAPNKPRIYPEHLPEETRSLEQKGRVTELMEFLGKHSDERILYLRDAMLEAKKGKQVYFSNDTHWNDYGSFMAHRAIVEYLQGILPGLKPVAPEEVKYTPEPIKGDLGVMTLTPDAFEVTREKLSVRSAAPLDERPLAISPVPEGEDYAVPGLPPVTTINPDGKYRAVVFHDSFGLFGLKELLPQVFEEVTFFHCYSDPRIIEEVVEKLKPDLVLDLVVERHLTQRVDEGNPRFMRFR